MHVYILDKVLSMCTSIPILLWVNKEYLYVYVYMSMHIICFEGEDLNIEEQHK